ncbi:MAG: hypothetical protein DI622_22080, partial [Chryseobacterium sp.]
RYVTDVNGNGSHMIYDGEDVSGMLSLYQGMSSGSSNSSNNAFPSLNHSYIDATGAGGGSSPTFQFPKGTEEYYQKNYPAFYDFVKNLLPNIVKDPNFLQAFMDITGMSQEEVIKAFTYGQGPTLHDWDVEFSNGQYDYAMSHHKDDLNNISISNMVLNWFEKANKDPKSVEGITNLFLMSGIIGHEGAHWGNNVKGPGEAMNNFINNFNGEHGEAFEYRVFKNDFKGVEPAKGHLQMGQIDSIPYNLTQYIKIHFNTLSKIFNH